MPKGSWHEFDTPEAMVRPGCTPLNVAKSERQVRVERTRGGKGGKTVTVVSGLELDSKSLRSLLKIFKSKCGTGGTIKGKDLELQGDRVQFVLDLLKKEGYSPKQSGG